MPNSEPKRTAPMKQSIALVSLVVREYDEALEFFVGKLGFVLVEDSYVPEQDTSPRSFSSSWRTKGNRSPKWNEPLKQAGCRPLSSAGPSDSQEQRHPRRGLVPVASYPSMRSAHSHRPAVAGMLAIVCLLAAGPLHAQPGFPPNDPDSWSAAVTAKILCSAMFVSGRDQAEAVAHAPVNYLVPKPDFDLQGGRRSPAKAGAAHPRRPHHPRSQALRRSGLRHPPARAATPCTSSPSR